MSKEFEIVREFEVDASPEEVWEAITTGTGGWLWPLEYEPQRGRRRRPSAAPSPHGTRRTG